MDKHSTVTCPRCAWAASVLCFSEGMAVDGRLNDLLIRHLAAEHQVKGEDATRESARRVAARASLAFAPVRV